MSRVGGFRGVRRLWRDHAVVLRTWAIFVSLFLALLVIFLRLGVYVQDAANRWTASATAVSLRLLGVEAEADGSFVSSSLIPVDIIFECTAVLPIMIYVAAVLAFPSPWRSKPLGIAIGVPALLLVNQVRLVSLFFIGRRFPEIFETAHLVVWQSLMIFITVVVWLVWAARVGDAVGSRRA